MTDYSFNEFAAIMINKNTLTDESLTIYNIKELFDGYVKHLIVRKINVDDIKKYRMEVVVNYYIDFYGINKNYDKNKLISQYKNSIVDDITNKLNPPKSFFTMARREYIANELKEKTEYENCDINTHYNTINKKYEYYRELNNSEERKRAIENDDNYIDYYYDNYEDDENNSSNYNSDDYDDYYCDYISEDDSEYYSDDY
jgi:hypothetical protein